MSNVTHITHEGEVVDHPSTAVQKLDPIVLPAVTAERALEAWKAFQELKNLILSPDDFQKIGGKDFPRKSAWRKLSNVFNLTVECVSEKEIKNDDGTIDFDVIYRAIAPNGRSMIGDGSCNTHEKNKENSRHNTRGSAHTRAFNRAVSNLIGGGEVSAEEVERESFRVPPSRNESLPAPDSYFPDPFEEQPPHTVESGDDEGEALSQNDSHHPAYLIQLGTMPGGVPHFLNGKSIREASERWNRQKNMSELDQAYKYYKGRTYRNAEITEFLKQAELFFTAKEKKS